MPTGLPLPSVPHLLTGTPADAARRLDDSADLEQSARRAERHAADPFAHLDREPPPEPTMTSSTVATAIAVSNLTPQVQEAQARICALIEEHKGKFRPDFRAWLIRNWHIWERFEDEAEAVWVRGIRRYSARTIIEFLRHWSTLRQVGGAYKINNSFVPCLGRVYALAYPSRAKFLETRELRKSTIRAPIREVSPAAP